MGQYPFGRFTVDLCLENDRCISKERKISDGLLRVEDIDKPAVGCQAGHGIPADGISFVGKGSYEIHGFSRIHPAVSVPTLAIIYCQAVQFQNRCR